MNIVRGFRRIGWVATVPVAAFVVLVFFESTKEYSASNYEARLLEDPCPQKKYQYSDLDIDGNAPDIQAIETPYFARAYISKEVPPNVANKVVADFAQNRRKKSDTCFVQFTVYKRVNKLKLTGLVAAAVAISAIVIQSLISVFAWIVRGFR